MTPVYPYCWVTIPQTNTIQNHLLDHPALLADFPKIFFPIADNYEQNKNKKNHPNLSIRSRVLPEKQTTIIFYL